MNDLHILLNYVKQFKNKTEAAKSLDMSLQRLSNIINGRAEIGASVREKLREQGAYNVVKDNKASNSQNLVKIVAEQNLYIKLLETDVKALKEKVESYEQYINFSKRSES